MKPPDLLPEFVREALEAEGELGESERAASAEALAALAALLPPLAPSSAGRARLLAATSTGAERFAPLFEKLGELFDLSLERIRELMALSDAPASWGPAPVPGLDLMHFAGGPRVATADTGLVRVPANFAFPRHRHLGEERVLIIAGGYREDAGKLYEPGDLHVMQPGTTHSYTTGPDGCLLALVLYTGVDIEGAAG